MNDSKEKHIDAMLSEDARLLEQVSDHAFLDEVFSNLEVAHNIIEAPMWRRPLIISSIAACLIVGLLIMGGAFLRISKPFTQYDSPLMTYHAKRLSEEVLIEQNGRASLPRLPLESSIIPFPAAPQGSEVLALETEIHATTLVEVPSVEINEPDAFMDEESFKESMAASHELLPGHPFTALTENPLSSFPLDTSLEGYASLLLCVDKGLRLDPLSVRIEDMINAFHYDYAHPDGDSSFSLNVETAESPWNPETRLVMVGIKGKDVYTFQKNKPIAQDVEVQLEFNPLQVAEYRLIGYAERTHDGAVSYVKEINAGHTVTALYEVVPRKELLEEDLISYGSAAAFQKGQRAEGLRGDLLPETSPAVDLFTVKLRYKTLNGKQSNLMQQPVKDAGTPFSEASADFRFASSVALFGMLLRESESLGGADFSTVERITTETLKGDTDRKVFLELVRKYRASL